MGHGPRKDKTMYQKEEKFELTYAVPTADGNEAVKRIYPKSKAKAEEQKGLCKKYGYRVISCKKLYPFNTYKNQHNFELIHNIVMNELYEIWHDGKKVSDAEYERLESLKEQSEKFFCLPLPVAWLPWEDWKDAKEMAENAIIHRQNACIEAGRYDLVTYC